VSTQIYPDNLEVEPSLAIDKSVFIDSTYDQTLFCCTMLYKDGYYCVREVSPNKISSQKSHQTTIPTLKESLLKKSFFTPMIPFQKGESVATSS
jgi:hypothetical protein